MHDVLLVITRPRNILLARFQRRADSMHTRNNALFILINLSEDRCPNPRHDAHIHHRIGRVRQLHSDLRHRPANRAHRVGKHIHRAPAHRPSEELLQPLPHDERILPVIRGARRVLRKRADERAVFHSRNVIGSGASEKAPRPQLLIQLRKRARLDQLIAEKVILRLRAVDPVDAIRLRKIGHLFHPADQVFIRSRRCGDGGLGGNCLHR